MNGSTDRQDHEPAAEAPPPVDPATRDVIDEPDGSSQAPATALGLLAEAHAALHASVGRLREEHESLERDILERQRARGKAEAKIDELTATIAHLEKQAEGWDEYLATEREKTERELNKSYLDLDAQKKDWEEKLNKLQSRESDIEKREASCDSHDSKLRSRKADLKEKEKKATRLKKAAEADHKVAAQALQSAEKDKASALIALHEAQAKITRLSAEAEAKIQQERTEWIAERAAERSDEWERIRSEQSDLATARAKLRAEQADLDAQAKDIDAIAEQQAGRKLQQARLEVMRVAAERNALAEEAEALQAERALREVSRRRTEGRDLDALDTDLQAARREIQALTTQLQTRPTEAEGDELTRLRRERDTWVAKRDDLSRDLEMLRAQKSSQDREVSDRADLREQVGFWQSKAEATRERFNELSRLVNRDHLSVAPFARCVEVDASPDFQSAPESRAINPDRPNVLRHLADEVHRRLLVQGLHFSVPTLRLYIAGLAASRLVLLQGPPGTGKTSLAVEFAKALGSGYGKVDVQPGWRDKQDLIGHYNPFERRFNETDFLLDLYKALTPRHAGLPYFVILDEVNLSRPEYYFADFLGGLEELAGGRPAWVPLTSRSFDNASEELSELMGAGHGKSQIPQLADVDAGTGLRLPIPPNVWFVGTANQDESTLMPAPRTLDRAHVQELPVVRDGQVPSSMRPPTPAGPLGHDDLESAFASAAQRHGSHAKEAKSFLVSIQDELERLSIGWTPRLLRQVKRFVPAYVASAPEGTDPAAAIAEAVDHLLVTKTIYKAEGKFTIRKGDLEDLSNHLESAALKRGWSLPRSVSEIARIARAL